ncbi:MAG: RDD family protein [Cephaloticoccus sp.]|nr:RDD family protein [Cephaloticoccus sp.]
MKPWKSFSELCSEFYLLFRRGLLPDVPAKYQTVPRRFAAVLIDSLVWLPWFIVHIYFGAGSSGALPPVSLSLATIAVGFAYPVYFIGRYGATPGMQIMRCKLVRLGDESPVSFGLTALRESPGLILVILNFCSRQFGWPAPDSMMWTHWTWQAVWLLPLLLSHKRRALHDIISGSVVIRTQVNDHTTINNWSRPHALIPGYEASRPIRRFGAGAVNLVIILIAIMATAEAAGSPGPLLSEDAALLWHWLLLSGLGLFWVGCTLLKSSPGAFVADLKSVNTDGTPLARDTAVLRNTPNLVMMLAYFFPPIESGHALPVIRAVISLAYVGLLIVNGFWLMHYRLTPIDQWLHIRVLEHVKLKT